MLWFVAPSASALRSRVCARYASGKHAVDARTREHQRDKGKCFEQDQSETGCAAEAASKASIVAARTTGWSLSTDQNRLADGGRKRGCVTASARPPTTAYHPPTATEWWSRTPRRIGLLPRTLF